MRSGRVASANSEASSASLSAAGYRAFLADPAPGGSDPVLRELLVCLAVAGFAAGNIMLLSVSVWSGAEGATRDLFHWISALIALPAIAFAGRPFFVNAARSLRHLGYTMDTLIALGAGSAFAFSTVVMAAGWLGTEVAGGAVYFESVAVILTLICVGKWMEAWGKAGPAPAPPRLPLL